MTDTEIVSMMMDDRQQNTGLRLLMSTYSERLYWVIRRIVESHDDTDDILQNTFIKAFRNIRRFESRSSLFTWLYRIATNEALSFRKVMMRKATQPLPESGMILAGGQVSHSDSEEQMLEKLDAALKSLPERQRQVFEMRYYDELSYEDIGELLGLSAGALKASYHHAAKKVEHYLIHMSAH